MCKCPTYSYGCDMLIEQIPPTYTWGTEVVTIPLKTRAYDVMKIIASRDSTTVDVTYTDYNRKCYFYPSLFIKFRTI